MNLFCDINSKEMKIPKILFIALSLAFLAFGQASAQTVNVKTTEYWETGYWCNGEFDVISGQFELHSILRINKANTLVWNKMMYISGEAISNFTGEIFRVNYFLKSEPFLPGIGSYQLSFHVNMVGDQGTHFIMAVTLAVDENGNTYIIRLKDKCL